MANEKQLKLIRKDVLEWNSYRKANSFAAIDLAGADLTETDLASADLFGARLDKSILERADLMHAGLATANLQGANLQGANLAFANLYCAILANADLREADLTGTNLAGADLRGANLSKSLLNGTVFGDSDLSHVKGLKSCQQYYPSTLDYATLRQSWPLPDVFLRKCGLPESLIKSLPSTLGTSNDYDSCFISYSTRDKQFANRLYTDLQDKGVRCWFAPHDMQAGKKLHDQIDTAIRAHRKFLLILSSASMKSEWVQTEILKARDREHRESRRILIPIRLVDHESLKAWECFDSDTGKDLAREIRDYFIPDFSLSKTSKRAYSDALTNLLRDLRIQKAGTAEL